MNLRYRHICLYRENAIAIESKAKYLFGGSVYYVTMQITLSIPEFTRNERNLHCDVLYITTDRVARLVLDDAIAAILTSRYRPLSRPLLRRLDRCDRVIQNESGDSIGGNV